MTVLGTPDADRQVGVRCRLAEIGRRMAHDAAERRTWREWFVVPGRGIGLSGVLPPAWWAVLLVLLSGLLARAHPAHGPRALFVLACIAFPVAIAVIVLGAGGWRLVGGALVCAVGPIANWQLPSSPAVAFTFIAIAVVLTRLELRWAIGFAAVCAAGFVVAGIADGEGSVGLIAYALGFLAAGTGAVNRRERQERAEQAELLLAETQRASEEQLRAATLDERARIAREIHDVLAHSLSALSVQLEAARLLLDQPDSRDRVAAHIDRARALTRAGVEETRRALTALRGEALPVPLLLETLVEEYREHCKATGHEASAVAEIDDVASRWPADVVLAVYRTAQEAVTNVRRHAPGADLRVTLTTSTDGVRLAVTNGKGAAADADAAGASTGYGLVGMRERARLLGGSLDAGADGDGWRVLLRLPLQADTDG